VVLQHLRKRLPLAQFFKVINDKAVASNLFEGWAHDHDRELLKDFYYQDDRKSASAAILIAESLQQQTLSSRVDKLQLARKIYSESKEYTFESKVDHSICFAENRFWMTRFGCSKCKNRMTRISNLVSALSGFPLMTH